MIRMRNELILRQQIVLERDLKQKQTLIKKVNGVLKAKGYEKVETIINALQEKGSIGSKEVELECKKSSATILINPPRNRKAGYPRVDIL